MVIAPMLDQQGLNLAVPEIVDAEQLKNDSKIMTLIVTSDNQILFDGQELEISSLEQFFSKEGKNYKDGLLIQADDNSRPCYDCSSAGNGWCN